MPDPTITLAILLIAQSLYVWRLLRRLNALRANCFLTNEKGHRVRYVDASAGVRDRAEGKA